MSPLLTRPSLADRGLVLLLALLCAASPSAPPRPASTCAPPPTTSRDQLFRDALYPATQVKVTYTRVAAGRMPGRRGRGRSTEALPPAVRTQCSPTAARVGDRPGDVAQRATARPSVPAFLTVVGLPGPRVARHDRVDGRLPDPGALRCRSPSSRAQHGGLPRQDRLDPDYALGLPEAEVVEVVLETVGGPRDERAGSTTGSPCRPGASVARPPRCSGRRHLRGRGSLPEPARRHRHRPRSRPSTRRPTPGPSAPAPWPPTAATVLRGDVGGRPTCAGPSTRPPRGPALTPSRWSRRPRGRAPVVAAARGGPDAVGAETGLGDIAAEVVSKRETSDGMALLGLTALAARWLRRAPRSGGRARRPTAYADRAWCAPAARVVRWLLGQRGGEALLLTLPRDRPWRPA